MRKSLALAWLVVVLMAMTAAPGAALPGNGAETAEYTRTECVYPTGAPDQWLSGNPPVWHVRDFPYLGILNDGGSFSGTNTGTVDIDLNTKSGSGSIRGTLNIDDFEMGTFEGSFSGHYRDGVWQGRGAANGTGEDTGQLLKMQLQGLDPDDCPPLETPVGQLGAVDAAQWDVVIINPGQ